MLLRVSSAPRFVLSVPLAMARVSRQPWLSKPVLLYTYVIRGTPLLVQLYMIYFGLAQFEWLRESVAWPMPKCVVLRLARLRAEHHGLHHRDLRRRAARRRPAGEIEAARSLGMSPLAIYRRILLPGALRRALPQYGNEVVMMMHATAIASAVTHRRAHPRRPATSITTTSLPAGGVRHRRGVLFRHDLRARGGLQAPRAPLPPPSASEVRRRRRDGPRASAATDMRIDTSPTSPAPGTRHELPCYRFGAPAPARCVYIQAALHADESRACSPARSPAAAARRRSRRGRR